MTVRRDFDKAAATWDEEPRRVQLARDVAAAIIAEAEPTQETDALDFGCGTGLLTLQLQPHVRSITGVDTSRGMLDVLEQKVREWGLANVSTRHIDADGGEQPDSAYHLIVSSMTLHHMTDLPSLFLQFHGLLLPGGVLCVADLVKEDGSFHDDATGVFHFGFDPAEVMGLLAGSGFTDIRSTTAAVIRRCSPTRTRDYPVFLISARTADSFLTMETMRSGLAPSAQL